MYHAERRNASSPLRHPHPFEMVSRRMNRGRRAVDRTGLLGHRQPALANMGAIIAGQPPTLTVPNN